MDYRTRWRLKGNPPINQLILTVLIKMYKV